MRTFASALLLSLLLCNTLAAQGFLLQLSIGKAAGKLPDDNEPTTVEVNFSPGSTGDVLFCCQLDDDRAKLQGIVVVRFRIEQ